jgi:hypothetical protein
VKSCIGIGVAFEYRLDTYAPNSSLDARLVGPDAFGRKQNTSFAGTHELLYTARLGCIVSSRVSVTQGWLTLRRSSRSPNDGDFKLLLSGSSNRSPQNLCSILEMWKPRVFWWPPVTDAIIDDGQCKRGNPE